MRLEAWAAPILRDAVLGPLLRMRAEQSVSSMQLEFRNNRDFWAGVMLIVTGAGSVIIARNYPFGTRCAWAPAISRSFSAGWCPVRPLPRRRGASQRNEKIEGAWSLRALIVLPLSLVLFGLLMEHAGFIPALLVLIFGSAAAGTEFKLVEVLLLAIGLTAFSVALFIYGLGLPYPLDRLDDAMDLFNNLALRLRRRASRCRTSLYCMLGVSVGTLIGVLPGIGPLATIAMLLPITFNVAAGRRADHAGRHLLRRAVRRLDHRDPRQPARRDVRRRHLHRRLPDGAAGPRRAGARHRRHRLVLRRHLRHAADRARRSAARGDRAEVRRAGIFLADADGPGRRRRARPGRHSQVARHGGDGPPPRHRRHRRQHRRAALSASASPNCPTASASSSSRSACSRSARSWPTSAIPGSARVFTAKVDEPVADAGGPESARAGRSCAARSSARSSACCRAPGRRSPRSRPTCWRRSSRRTPRASARARSRAWPAPRPPTTPTRSASSSRC